MKKEGFGAGALFMARQVEVAGILGLSRLLADLERCPECFVIRGEPLPDIDLTKPVRRKSKPDKAGWRWFREPEGGLSWVMLDFDEVAASAGMDLVGDPDEAIEYLIGRLPEPFWDASCHWQLSSSAGMDDGSTISAHLWFWLDRPMRRAELEAWADTLDIALDRSVFREVQPHYTAAPIFVHMTDPLPRRSGLRVGIEDAVALPAIEPRARHRASGAGGGGAFRAAPGFETKLRHLGDKPGNPEGHGFHSVLLSATAAYASEHGREGTDVGALKERLRAAIEAAPKRPGRDTDIERYLSDEYLDDLIESALASFAKKSGPDCHGLMPCYPAAAQPRDEALALQRSTMTEWWDRSLLAIRFERELTARKEAAWAAEGVGPDDVSSFGSVYDFNDDPEIRLRKVRGTRPKITKRVKRELLKEWGLAKAPKGKEKLLLSGSQGSGKSRTAAELIAATNVPGLVIWWLLPTIVKCDEQAGEYIRLMGPGSPAPMVVRGRRAPDPHRNKKAMCPRAEVVNRAAVAGVDVKKQICAACPQRETCGYLKQESAIAAMSGGVFLEAHDFAWLPSPAPSPDLVVVDESPLQRAWRIVSFHLNRLRDTGWWQTVGMNQTLDVREVLVLVHAAVLEHRTRILAALLDAALTWEKLSRTTIYLNEASQPKQLPISGRMSDAELDEELEKFERGELHKVAAMMRQITREWHTGRTSLDTVIFDPAAVVKVDDETREEPRVIVYRQRRPGMSAPILALDLGLNRKFWGDDMTEVRVAIERNAETTQTKGKAFSRQSLTGLDSQGRPRSPQKVEEAAVLRRQIGDFVAGAPGTRKLVTSTKKAEGALADVLPPGTMQAHFGALRGINAFEECDSGFSIGREQPSMAQIEEMTRPFTATDREPFFSILTNDEFGGQGVRQTRGVRMRDGSVRPVVVQVHPDPRCQAMLEQIREAEVVQGLDRVRPIFNHRLLYLLNALACDVTVDRLVTWSELRSGGNRFEQAFARTGRLVMPLTDGEISRCFNDLFPSAKAVECARTQGSENPLHFPIDYLLGKRGVFFCTYRRPGQRGQASRAVVAGDVPDPLAALVAVVGPVTAFAREDTNRAEWPEADAESEASAEESGSPDPAPGDEPSAEAIDVEPAPPVDVAGTPMSDIMRPIAERVDTVAPCTSMRWSPMPLRSQAVAWVSASAALRNSRSSLSAMTWPASRRPSVASNCWPPGRRASGLPALVPGSRITATRSNALAAA